MFYTIPIFDFFRGGDWWSFDMGRSLFGRLLSFFLLSGCCFGWSFLEYCDFPRNVSPPSSSLTLDGFVRVVRHGARSPVCWLPNLIASPPWECSAFDSISLFQGNERSSKVVPLNNCGTSDDTFIPYAQLTAFGANQHFLLGSLLAKRCPFELNIRAANIQRCMLSAQQHISGFESLRNSSNQVSTVYGYEVSHVSF